MECEITLADGTIVKCRPVPPWAVTELVARIPAPQFPYMDLKSVAGGTERRPALMGTPEWDEWTKVNQAYKMEVADALTSLRLHYGIVAWCYPDTEEFQVAPPAGWTVDPILTTVLGIATATVAHELRVQFIKYELLKTKSDSDLVDKLLDGEQQTVAVEEVQASLAPFGSTEETEQP